MGSKFPRWLVYLLAVLASFTFTLTFNLGDDGGKSVTVVVGGPHGTPTRSLTVPAAAVTAAGDLGGHDGARSEAPAGMTSTQLDQVEAQQEALAATDQLPIVTPDAAPEQRGCVTGSSRTTRAGAACGRGSSCCTTRSRRTGRAGRRERGRLRVQPAGVSGESNYVIDNEGHCAYIVRESDKAWTQAALNPVSISVEVINSGHEPRTPALPGSRRSRSSSRRAAPVGHPGAARRRRQRRRRSGRGSSTTGCSASPAAATTTSRRSCGALPPRWWESADAFARVLEQHGTHKAMAAAHGPVAVSTLSKYRNLHKSGHGARGPLGEARTELNAEGELELVTEPSADELGDVDELLRGRGLDPEEWAVDRLTVNEWQALAYGGGPDGEARVVTLRQLKAILRRRLSFAIVFPGREPAPLDLEREAQLAGNDQLIAMFSCAQAPNADEELEQLTLEWLEENRPARWADLGDLMDLPTISRHRDNPAFSQSAQECVDAGYAILRRRREASPGSEAVLLAGNHDDRFRTELLTRAERLYGLRPAATGDELEEHVLSLRTLLHLDHLGIDYLETARGGNYEHAELELAPELVARHGWLTGPNAGARSAAQLGRSVIVGHTHAQGIGVVMQARAGGRHRLLGMEVGCLCRTDEGLGYTVNPAWSPGFGTVTLLEGGRFHLELATYDTADRRLVWRDQDYKATLTRRPR
jgi:hypothetical protein